MDEQIYEDIKQRISDRYDRRMGFAIHLVVFVALAVIFLVVLGWASNIVLQIIAALWFVGLLGHGVSVVFEELRDRAIDRELERAGLLTPYQLDKAKRTPERLVTLSDDGELEEMFEEGDKGYEERRVQQE